ncbi:hypothetical protein K438DRAFT_551160 [Mycena galopus ATCC 62051]|nr:hypothetical protein K438DRAFT_551160 [Mycena galopus ATCC 62051]
MAHALFICVAGLGVATVGFLLSVLATLITRFTARLSGQEQPTPLQLRNAAVTASTRSSSLPLTPESDSFSDKAALPSKRRVRRERLYINVPEKTRREPDFEAKRKRSKSLDKLSPGATPTQRVHVVHFLTPTRNVPLISISPPPTQMRMSILSDSSTSTDSYATVSPTDTIASFESVGPEDESPPAAPQPPPAAEETRGRRGRFSKIAQLFSDKRGNSKPRRRESLPALRYGEGEAPAPASDIPPVPPLPPLPPLPLSPTTSMRRPRASLSSIAPPPPPESPTLRSQPVTQKPRRRRSRAYLLSVSFPAHCLLRLFSSPVLVRTASCPGLHHSRRNSTHDAPAVPPIPQSPSSPLQSPVRSSDQSPVRSPTSASKKPSLRKEKKDKEPAPRLRTHPYEAPYFIPPPDMAGVEEPLTRRRPSRRRTTPPESATVSPSRT